MASRADRFNVSWSVNLWDRFDVLADYVQKGIDSSKDFVSFFRDQYEIEMEYAEKLEKLVSKYESKKMACSDPTQTSAFDVVLTVTKAKYEQQRILTTKLKTDIVDELALAIVLLTQRNKKIAETKGEKTALLKEAFVWFHKRRLGYERSLEKTRQCSRDFGDAFHNKHVSGEKLNKLRVRLLRKGEDCELERMDYAAQYVLTNQTQLKFYFHWLPHVVSQLQRIEQQRLGHIKESLLALATIRHHAVPGIMHTVDHLGAVSTGIDVNRLLRAVVHKFRTGIPQPHHLPFNFPLPLKAGRSTEPPPPALHTFGVPEIQRQRDDVVHREAESRRKSHSVGRFQVKHLDTLSLEQDAEICEPNETSI